MPEQSASANFRVVLLATGGTIEKTYDAHSGALTLDVPVIESLVAALDMPDVACRIRRVLAKDSLDMTDADRAALVDAARSALAGDDCDALVITHGTDTLARSAALLDTALAGLSRPVVLTGAMRPARVADSDAAQNLAQALLAARLLEPGVYAALHGRILRAPAIAKDHANLTLVPAAP